MHVLHLSCEAIESFRFPTACTATENHLLPSTILEKAVRLGYGLVANHPFVDGNKRIGILVMLTFLELNSVSVEFKDSEIVDMALGVASGLYKYEDLLQMVKDRL